MKRQSGFRSGMKSASEPEIDSESSLVPHPDWLKLPLDVTAEILGRVGVADILNNAQKVCALWYKLCKDPSMWRRIDMRDLWDPTFVEYVLVKMCMHAIDRSAGLLTDINVEDFGDDDLLAYIADRSSNLRRLRLVSCYNVSEEGLSEAASKFPLLEVLEISFGNIEENALRNVGRSCPHLRSLKYNNRGFRTPVILHDEVAFSIAESMHALRDLQLFGNKLTNTGLMAILDGCPDIESLDLRQCYNVRLGGDLEKRCSERVKFLRRPNDSADDYEFGAGTDEGGSDKASDYDYSDEFYDYDEYYDYFYSSDGNNTDDEFSL